MNKIIKIFFVVFLLSGCGYQPILLKKDYDFSFNKIELEGDLVINKIMENYLLDRIKNEGTKKLDLYILSKKNKEIVSSNKKGDPTIYKLNIIVDYYLVQNEIIIFKNKILKQSTYNNINDKFELLKYEENIVKNLSERFADDILISATGIEK
tara:strand:+ start:3343 stop:3801 length:459 start_codon:yes stop_codon:yes gene_type:complete